MILGKRVGGDPAGPKHSLKPWISGPRVGGRGLRWVGMGRGGGVEEGWRHNPAIHIYSAAHQYAKEVWGHRGAHNLPS